MDKRTIAIAVACIVLAFTWPTILHHFYPTPKPQPGTPTHATNAVAASSHTVAPTNPPPAAVAAKPAPEVPAVAPKPDEPRPAEQEIVLENEEVKAVFTTYGGGIKRIELKKYPATKDAPAPVVLNQFGKAPMGAVSGLEGFDATTAYRVAHTADSITLEAENAAGLKVIKEFRIGSNYMIDGSFSVVNQGAQALSSARLWIDLGTASAVVPADKFEIPYVDWSDGKELKTTDPSTFSSSWITRRAARDVISYDDVKLAWAGLEDRFFCALWMPQGASNALTTASLQITHEPIEQPDFHAGQTRRPTDWGVIGKMATPPIHLATGGTYHYPFRLYAGPKEYRKLQELGQGQTEVMHWGWFEWIGELLLKAMTLLYHTILPNYFFVIIAITLLIKLIFWPLTAMSNRSMKAMQALQPKMTALREKLKDDPQKLNAEMMKLYKEHKVNPMAGCLPTVVQMPVFFGLYYMLRSAIELRMHGFLWVHDLSQPDSVAQFGSFFLNPLPLAMGVTMVWQMKSTPSTGDPTQQKMMMFMPLMFLFFCYGMPSGLVLYWTVQNLFTIFQMKLTRHAPPAGAALPAPASGKPPKSKPR